MAQVAAQRPLLPPDSLHGAHRACPWTKGRSSECSCRASSTAGKIV